MWIDLDPCRKFLPLYKQASASSGDIPSELSLFYSSEALLS